MSRAAPASAFAAAWLAAWLAAAAAFGQLPDNTEPTLDPESPLSDDYRRSIEEADERERQEAVGSGASSLPTMLGTGETQSLPQQPAPATAADVQPAAPEAAAPTPPAFGARQPTQPDYTPYPATTERRARTPRHELLQQLVDGWSRTPDIVRVVRRIAEPAPAQAARAPGAPGAADPAAAAAPAPPPVPPGTGLYGRLLYTVSNEFPGPVLVEILEPPLAGAVVIGRFETSGENFILRFSTLRRGNATEGVDAIAVGLDCACYGIDADVDRHWFARVILPAAAAFAETFLRALSLPSQTLRLADGTVLTETADPADTALEAGAAAGLRAGSDALREDLPRTPTLTIPAGTEMVVMFVGAAPARPAAALPAEAAP